MPDVTIPPRPEPGSGVLHHVELWVPDLLRAEASWGWLLTELGATPFRSWEHGRSWRWDDGPYVVLEQSPALTGDRHDRRAPGLNHLAFRVPGRPRTAARGERAGRSADGARALDALVAAAPDHGWTLLFTDRHPFAGGPDHRAAYLADADGYEVELVASP